MLSGGVDGDNYRDYAASAEQVYQSVVGELSRLPRPLGRYGDADQIALLQPLIEHSDWWPRKVFDELLRSAPGIDPTAFGCDDAGRLSR